MFGGLCGNPKIETQKELVHLHLGLRGFRAWGPKALEFQLEPLSCRGWGTARGLFPDVGFRVEFVYSVGT